MTQNYKRLTIIICLCDRAAGHRLRLTLARHRAAILHSATSGTCAWDMFKGRRVWVARFAYAGEALRAAGGARGQIARIHYSLAPVRGHTEHHARAQAYTHK